MRNLIIIITLFLCSGLSAQNITISFSSKKAGVVIDSISVTNQRTGQKVKLAETEQLDLKNLVGVADLKLETNQGYVYPNPCYGDASLIFPTGSSGMVNIGLYNLTGQLLTSNSGRLLPGMNRFSIRFPAAGIFFLSVENEKKQYGFKVVCHTGWFQSGTIELEGTEVSESGQTGKELKSGSVPKVMNYLDGDILQCSACSGKNTTIIADSPVTSKVYEVEFYACTDYDNFSYPILKIGDQWWMARNLQTVKYSDGASITNVTDNTAWNNSTTGAYCWYKNDISNKANYGALYNWFTVKTGKLCPAGWHIPADAEWTTFENYLISNGYNYDGTQNGNKIAKSIAATTFWASNATAGAVGNTDYPAYRNKTGFSGLPAGYRDYTGTYGLVTSECYWWSSTENTATNAWFRYLYTNFSSEGRYNYDKLYGFSIRCVKD